MKQNYDPDEDLVVKAKAARRLSGSRGPLPANRLALVMAILRGEVTIRQAGRALGRESGNVQARLGGYLMRAIRAGQVEIREVEKK